MNLNNDLRISGGSRINQTAVDPLPINTEQIPSESGNGGGAGVPSTGLKKEDAGQTGR